MPGEDCWAPGAGTARARRRVVVVCGVAALAVAVGAWAVLRSPGGPRPVTPAPAGRYRHTAAATAGWCGWWYRRMAQEAGADLWHMSNIAGPELFFKAPELPVARWINLPHAGSYIFVAADGRRFIAEGDQSWEPTGTGRSTTTACGCSKPHRCRST